MTDHDPDAADRWNAIHPVGTPVLAWPAHRDAEPMTTRTRTPAWTLGHGNAVVSVEGLSWATGMGSTSARCFGTTADVRSPVGTRSSLLARTEMPVVDERTAEHLSEPKDLAPLVPRRLATDKGYTGGIRLAHIEPRNIDDQPTGQLYPCGITVFCDDCGTEVRGDYIVSDLMTGAERLAVARTWLVEARGWQCGPDGDFCPQHATPDPS